MFIIITHITHIYLHPIYNMPQIQLSTSGFPAHQEMPITDDTNRCKDQIIYMQILMIPMSKKLYLRWCNWEMARIITHVSTVQSQGLLCPWWVACFKWSSHMYHLLHAYTETWLKQWASCWVPGARLTKAYDVTIQRYRNSHAKIEDSKMHILRCMGSKFCVKFQRCPLKFHTKFWTHTPQNINVTRC